MARAPYLFATALALTALAAPPAHAASATVTLRVGPEGFVVPSSWLVNNQAVWVVDPAQTPELNALPGVAGCSVSAADANGDGAVDGGEVLDAATASGCISGWASQSFGGSRFVTSVDGLDQTAGGLTTWWLVQQNGYATPVGIDGLSLADGDSLDFVYYVGPV